MHNLPSAASCDSTQLVPIAVRNKTESRTSSRLCKKRTKGCASVGLARQSARCWFCMCHVDIMQRHPGEHNPSTCSLATKLLLATSESSPAPYPSAVHVLRQSPPLSRPPPGAKAFFEKRTCNDNPMRQSLLYWTKCAKEAAGSSVQLAQDSFPHLPASIVSISGALERTEGGRILPSFSRR